MPMIDTIKQIVFSNSASQEALLRHFPKAQNFDAALQQLFLQTTENQIQTILAPFLRDVTINHMRNSELSEYAIAFRTAFLQRLEPTDLLEYLTLQARNREWATEVEAGALADLLDMRVKITTVNDGVPQTPFVVGLENDSREPLVHLYNENNTHWYLYEGQSYRTIGDGNCLYNAFAQIIWHMVRNENQLNMQRNALVSEPLEIDPLIYKYQIALLESLNGVPVKSVHDLVEEIIHHVKRAEVDDHQLASALVLSELLTEDPKKKITVKVTDEQLKKREKCFALLVKLREISRASEELEKTAKNDARYETAASVSKALVQKLNKYFNLFLKNDDYSMFKNKCNQAIKKSKAILEPHWNWKQLLANLTLAILGLGVFYLAAVIYNKHTTGNYWFFKPEPFAGHDQLKCEGLIKT